MRARPAHVLHVEHETPTVLRVHVERPLGFQFRAGQHALLRLTTNQGPDLRPLSLASPPDKDTLEFATRQGPSAFKQALAALRPGDTVKVSRPMGGFRYDHARPAVLIAGGMGITPFRSVLLQREARASTKPVRLLFSNRNADDIPYRKELDGLALRLQNFHLTWVLTSPGSADVDGTTHHGRICDSLLQQHAAQLPDPLFYVAGSAAMVSDVITMLLRVGVNHRNIRKVTQGR